MGEHEHTLAGKLIRNFNAVPLQRDLRAPLDDSLCARMNTGMAAQKLGVSVDTVAPGMRSCSYHFHQAQEEMVVVIGGSGTLRVAGSMLPIRTGDVIVIPAGPAYPHQIIKPSDAPLQYLSISTRETPEICEYPDSGTFSAFASTDGVRAFDGIQRVSNNLDYWDGEA